MYRIILFLTIGILSCGQPKVAVKDHHANQDTLIDNEAALFAEKKAALDQLFLAHRDSSAFSAQDMWTSLLIGHLFSPHEKDAVLRYNDNDSVANVIVLRQSGESWDTIFSTKVCPVETGSFDEKIAISDFNGDDIPDLKIIRRFWDIHYGENADLWLYINDRFTKVEGFDKIVSATYDKGTHLIYSYQSAGCGDMAMYFGVFSIQGNQVKTVRELSCDCCTRDDSCYINVFGQAPYAVPYESAYKHVPAFYAGAVKEKLRITSGQ